MAGYVFNRGALGLANRSIDWVNDTIKVRPVLTADTPSKDATSMTGLGVTGNDVTVGSKTITEDQANDRVVFDFADPTFPSQPAGGEINKVIVFKFSANDAGSIPIAVCEASAAKTPNGGDLAITLSADGAFYLQQ